MLLKAYATILRELCNTAQHSRFLFARSMCYLRVDGYMFPMVDGVNVRKTPATDYILRKKEYIH